MIERATHANWPNKAKAPKALKYAAAGGFFGLGHAVKMAASAWLQGPNLGQMWSYFSAQSLLFRMSSLVIAVGFPALGVQVVRMVRTMLSQKVQLVHREFVLNAVLLACTLLASFNVIFHLWYDFGILPFAQADLAAFQEGKTSLLQSLTVVERTYRVRLGLTFQLTDDSQSSLEIKFPSIDVPSVQSLKIHMSVDNKTDKSTVPVTITYTPEGVNVDNAVDALRRLRPDKLSREFIFPIPLKLLNDSGFRTNGNTLTLNDLELSLKDTDETARPVIVELRVINDAGTSAAHPVRFPEDSSAQLRVFSGKTAALYSPNECFAVQPFHWHGLADDSIPSPKDFQLRTEFSITGFSRPHCDNPTRRRPTAFGWRRSIWGGFQVGADQLLSQSYFWHAFLGRRNM